MITLLGRARPICVDVASLLSTLAFDPCTNNQVLICRVEAGHVHRIAVARSVLQLVEDRSRCVADVHLIVISLSGPSFCREISTIDHGIEPFRCVEECTVECKS